MADLPTGTVAFLFTDIEGSTQFTCPMVKVFFCLTDVGSNQGEFVIVAHCVI